MSRLHFIPANLRDGESGSIPASVLDNGIVARTLLDIVGPGRVHEVESVTSPDRGYLVQEDVATEYRRRLDAARSGASRRTGTETPAAEKPAKRVATKNRT